MLEIQTILQIFLQITDKNNVRDTNYFTNFFTNS